MAIATAHRNAGRQCGHSRSAPLAAPSRPQPRRQRHFRNIRAASWVETRDAASGANACRARRKHGCRVLRQGRQATLQRADTLVVIPEECQSIPITAPKDWSQKGCASRRNNSSRPNSRTPAGSSDRPAIWARGRCAAAGLRCPHAAPSGPTRCYDVSSADRWQRWGIKVTLSDL
jgi:hypothetical protein